jgi:hypothetical protein
MNARPDCIWLVTGDVRNVGGICLFLCGTIERFDVAIHEVRSKIVPHYGDEIGRECEIGRAHV